MRITSGKAALYSASTELMTSSSFMASTASALMSAVCPRLCHSASTNRARWRQLSADHALCSVISIGRSPAVQPGAGQSTCLLHTSQEQQVRISKYVDHPAYKYETKALSSQICSSGNGVKNNACTSYHRFHCFAPQQVTCTCNGI